MLKPSEVAARCRVDVERVLAWIKAGELKAANVATKANAKKPRWVVLESEMMRFLECRTARTTSNKPETTNPKKPTRSTRERVRKPVKFF
jgi:hypothetical protein